MPNCPICDSSLPEVSDRCQTCQTHVGAPNVRLAARAEEQSALTARFNKAIDDAQARGIETVVSDFQRSVQNSVVTVNCDLSFLKDFISRDTTLYANYHQGVRAGTRKAAEEAFDRQRSSVDALMFGSMASEIVFGALSLTCRGLISYGPACMQLREVTIRERASLLEENSYDFVKRHGIRPERCKPYGYISIWSDRDKLAVAKHESSMTTSTTQDDYQGMLLFSDGDRTRDRFIEVHIHRSFDHKAIEKISCKQPTEALGEAIWAVVQDLSGRLGIATETYS